MIISVTLTCAVRLTFRGIQLLTARVQRLSLKVAPTVILLSEFFYDPRLSTMVKANTEKSFGIGFFGCSHISRLGKSGRVARGEDGKGGHKTVLS